MGNKADKIPDVTRGRWTGAQTCVNPHIPADGRAREEESGEGTHGGVMWAGRARRAGRPGVGPQEGPPAGPTCLRQREIQASLDAINQRRNAAG